MVKIMSLHSSNMSWQREIMAADKIKVTNHLTLKQKDSPGLSGGLSEVMSP